MRRAERSAPMTRFLEIKFNNAWRGIDLTKIESRPLKTALGEYFFIVDINNEKEDLVSFAMKELEAIGITYKILGNYTVYTISEQ